MATGIGFGRRGKTTGPHSSVPGPGARGRRGAGLARRLAAVALAAALAGAAIAQTPDGAADRAAFDAAMADFKRGDYPAALTRLLPLAEAGDAAAQYNLGFMRARGLGAPADLLEAYVWFSLVALQDQARGAVARDEVGMRLAPSELSEAQRRIAARRGR